MRIRYMLDQERLMEKQTFKTGMHIFVADKGDYYDISDELPQYQEWN